MVGLSFACARPRLRKRARAPMPARAIASFGSPSVLSAMPVLNTAGRENVSSELRSALDRRRLFSFGAHIAPCYGLAVSTQRLPSRIFLLGLLLWLAVLGLACDSSSAPRLALIADQPVVETAGAA